jgi:hypothetical protein
VFVFLERREAGGGITVPWITFAWNASSAGDPARLVSHRNCTRRGDCESGPRCFGSSYSYAFLCNKIVTVLRECMVTQCADTDIHSFIHSFINESTALCWTLAPSQIRNLFCTDGRTPWTGDQPVARPLPTHKTTRTQNKLHAWSGIRTHDPSVRASEDSSCLRTRGHCDRHALVIGSTNSCQ